jgi:hypothetical protein
MQWLALRNPVHIGLNSRQCGLDISAFVCVGVIVAKLVQDDVRGYVLPSKVIVLISNNAPIFRISQVRVRSRIMSRRSNQTVHELRLHR